MQKKKTLGTDSIPMRSKSLKEKKIAVKPELKNSKSDTDIYKAKLSALRKENRLLKGTINNKQSKLTNKIQKPRKNILWNSKNIEKLLNLTPELIFIYDEIKNKFLFINKSLENLLGYKLNDFNKSDNNDFLNEIIHKDDKKEYLEKTVQRFKELKDDEYIENYFRLKNLKGKYLWFHEYECIFERNSKGQPSSKLGIMTDITSLKKTEKKLQILNEQFLNAQKIAKLGYWEYEPKTQKIEWTPELYKIYGYEPYSITPTKELILESLDEESNIIVKRVYENLQKKQENDFNIRIITKQNETYHIYVTLNASFKSDGTLKKIKGTAQDITQKKITEKKIKDYAALLEKENKNKNKFISILAHDLKSPFAGMLGYSELLSEDFQYLSREDIHTYVLEMNSSLKNVYNLIENLLEWTKLHSENISFAPENVNLFEIISESAISLKNIYKDIDIQFSLDIPENAIVLGDEKMLNLVFNNLISNSYKFTEKGGSIVLTVTEKGDFYDISISDTGIGIPPENIKKLFKIEENFSTPGTSNEKGSGLGLILCKEFLKLHKSNLEVNSETGIGTTFNFTLKKYKNNAL